MNKELKTFEYLGVALAAIGFTLLSAGIYLPGFVIGFFSCLILIPYFQIRYQFGLAILQFYFLCANIYGIFNTWG